MTPLPESQPPASRAEQRAPERAEDVTEILARFARRASMDAPTGTIQLAGREPVAFAGWLDLMARVEEMLAEEGGGQIP